MKQDSVTVAHQLARSAMLFQKAFSQFHRAELLHDLKGCKPGSVGVLILLKNAASKETRELKVSEISRPMHVTSPAITQFIKGLEADGLVERRIARADRRSVGVMLTPLGEEVARKAEQSFATAFSGLA